MVFPSRPTVGRCSRFSSFWRMPRTSAQDCRSSGSKRRTKNRHVARLVSEACNLSESRHSLPDLCEHCPHPQCIAVRPDGWKAHKDLCGVGKHVSATSKNKTHDQQTRAEYQQPFESYPASLHGGLDGNRRLGVFNRTQEFHVTLHFIRISPLFTNGQRSQVF